MAVVHRSRGAGFVYGLGAPRRRGLLAFLNGDGLSGYGAGGDASYLGAYDTTADAQRYRDMGWSEDEIARQIQTENERRVWDPYFGMSAFTGWTEAEKTAYWAGQSADGLANIGYVPGPNGYDAAEYRAALTRYQQQNASLIANVTARYNDFMNAGHAANVAATDYVALSGGDLGRWFALVSPGTPRYSTINGSRVDNALLYYAAAKAGGQDVSGLAASVAQAQAESDANYQYALTHGGFSTPADNPNAKPISQTATFGPTTATTKTTATTGYTSTGQELVWDDVNKKWVPTGQYRAEYATTWPAATGGGGALVAANSGGSMSMPSGSGGGFGGGGSGIDVAGGGGAGGAFGQLVAGVPGGMLGVFAILGALVFASSKRGRR